jgi:hypothetical protein
LIPETNEEINPVEKPSVSLRKPIAFSQNGSTGLITDGEVIKKKRGRKPKSEINTEADNTVRFYLFKSLFTNEFFRQMINNLL